VEIDCYHSDLDSEGTTNRITVEWWAGDERVGERSAEGVDCSSTGADPEFEITTGSPITGIVVTTNGSDAFYIDELRIYKEDVLVNHHGRDNGSGWCVSTDPADAQGTWRNNISGSCRAQQAFSVR
jgi:hypothetical protein